jgi:hypothetical protein
MSLADIVEKRKNTRAVQVEEDWGPKVVPNKKYRLTASALLKEMNWSLPLTGRGRSFDAPRSIPARRMPSALAEGRLPREG